MWRWTRWVISMPRFPATARKRLPLSALSLTTTLHSMPVVPTSRPALCPITMAATSSLSPGIVSSPKKFPELLAHKGEDLIVTDGTTLLGADDKAGIAEIVQAMCYLRDHDEIKHGDIRVGFNPDEEIGMGAHHFDVEKFGCDWAYTMDGGDIGDLEYENFNAASAKVTIKGVSVHTGYAKGKMVNASRLACEFNSHIPDTDIPETTEGYEGFYHLLSINSHCEEAKLSYIIRDHDRKKFEDRKDFMENIARQMNDKYGEGTVSIEPEGPVLQHEGED